jgi:hypothetical protein
MVVGLFLGKKTYSKLGCSKQNGFDSTHQLTKYKIGNYAEDLTQTVKKVLLLSEIAGLARQCLVESMSQNVELSRPMPISQRFSSSEIRGLLTIETPSHDEADQDKTGSRQVSTEGQNLLQASDRSKIRDLLGDWEDPDLDTQYQVGVHCDISGHRSHFTLFPFLCC